MNADPAVMEHFVEPLDRARSDALLDRIGAMWDERGWGPWALERLDTGELAGLTGLAPATFEAPFTPAVEVGWRLARQHWGHGFASEAAGEALRVASDELGLDEVVSFTAVGNTRSRAVMERIGLVHDPAGDFDHPSVPPGHRLRRHVLYRTGARSRLAEPRQDGPRQDERAAPAG